MHKVIVALVGSLLLSISAVASAETIYILNRGGAFGLAVNSVITYLGSQGHTVTQSATNATFPPVASLTGIDQVWVFNSGPGVTVAEFSNMGDFLQTGGAIYHNGEFQANDMTAMSNTLTALLVPALSGAVSVNLFPGANVLPVTYSSGILGGSACLPTITANTSAYSYMAGVPAQNQLLETSNMENVNSVFFGADLIAGHGVLMMAGDNALFYSGSLNQGVVDLYVEVLQNGRNGAACPIIPPPPAAAPVPANDYRFLLTLVVLMLVGSVFSAARFKIKNSR